MSINILIIISMYLCIGGGIEGDKDGVPGGVGELLLQLPAHSLTPVQAQQVPISQICIEDTPTLRSCPHPAWNPVYALDWSLLQ